MSSIIQNSKLNKKNGFQRWALFILQSLRRRGQDLQNSFVSLIGIRSLSFKKLCAVLYFVLLPIGNCFAYGDNNRPVISYFVDNVVFEIIASGGYYSLGTMVVLAILAWRFKKFREVLLSILMAIFGIILLVFIYQALEDFDWLPEVY